MSTDIRMITTHHLDSKEDRTNVERILFGFHPHSISAQSGNIVMSSLDGRHITITTRYDDVAVEELIDFQSGVPAGKYRHTKDEFLSMVSSHAKTMDGWVKFATDTHVANLQVSIPVALRLLQAYDWVTQVIYYPREKS